MIRETMDMIVAVTMAIVFGVGVGGAVSLEIGTEWGSVFGLFASVIIGTAFYIKDSF